VPWKQRVAMDGTEIDCPAGSIPGQNTRRQARATDVEPSCPISMTLQSGDSQPFTLNALMSAAHRRASWPPALQRR
jgi:hypothetical protein